MTLWNARPLGDTLRLLSEAPSIVPESTDRAAFALAADSADRVWTTDRHPRILVVHGDTADLILTVLDRLSDWTRDASDELTAIASDISNLKTHVQREARRAHPES